MPSFSFLAAVQGSSETEEGGHTLAHTHTCTHLVHHAVVARRVLVLRAEEAEHAQPVVDGDQDDLLVQDVVGFVLGGRPADEVAPVDPHQDRAFLAGDQVAGEHAQPQAVLGACKKYVREGLSL